MSPNNRVDQELMAIISNINQLPATELRYYLFLLSAELKNQNATQSSILLRELNELICVINQYYKSQSQELINDRLQDINKRLIQLEKNTITHGRFWRIQKILLNICACICAITLGLIASAFGLTIGLFTQINVLKGGALGFISGLCIGLIIGFRLPGKIFIDPWNAKMDLAFHELKKITHPIQLEANRREQAQDEKNAKEYILNTFFNDDVLQNPDAKNEAFNQFLATEQSFEVCTTQNGFIDRSLKGHLGNHSFIRYKINEIKAPAMEFGPRTRYPNWVDQQESTRTVSGQKLFEMIVLDRQLQKNHAMNLSFVFNSFRAGDNDCLTYVDKILLGTGQAPTAVKRFCQKTDTWTGTHIVGKLFRFFNKTEEHELGSICTYLEGSKALEVITRTRK